MGSEEVFASWMEFTPLERAHVRTTLFVAYVGAKWWLGLVWTLYRGEFQAISTSPGCLSQALPWLAPLSSCAMMAPLRGERVATFQS